MAGSPATALSGKAAPTRWAPISTRSPTEIKLAQTTEAVKLRDDELFITRTFDAPLSVVWRMWQDRDHMIRWWGPEGFTVTDLSSDFRPGGAWRVGMTSSMFPKCWSSGEYLEIEP